MEFIEEIKQFTKRISAIKNTVATEEATKMSLIVPVFSILGYDVFNPLEFCPEYVADVGIKKGEKIDYAILKDNKPIILIECKSCSENLDKHSSQLFRYFGASAAKFGILTNGIVYRFYTDLEQPNKMDLVPFLEIDMENVKDYQISELKKFCKDRFDTDQIFSTAEELKYTHFIKKLFMKEFEEPSAAFIKYTISNVYDGPKSQKVIDKFTPLIKKAFQSFVNELVTSKISSALETEDSAEDNKAEKDTDKTLEEKQQEPESKIVTTDMEIEAFYVIRGILAGTVDLKNVVHRDTESYFGIIYQDNNRKPICRLKLDGKTMQLMLPDQNKNFTKYVISSLDDIYNYRDKIIEAAKFYA